MYQQRALPVPVRHAADESHLAVAPFGRAAIDVDALVRELAASTTLSTATPTKTTTTATTTSPGAARHTVRAPQSPAAAVPATPLRARASRPMASVASAPALHVTPATKNAHAHHVAATIPRRRA